MKQLSRDCYSESQPVPNHDTHIQDFMESSKSPDSFRIGCGEFENEEQRKHIYSKTLKKRLTRRRVKALLATLSDNGERSAPDVDVIINHCLRPFAILLRIGEGSMIYQSVIHKSLEYDRLPLLQGPSEFPSSPRCEIWAAFRQEQ